MLGCTGFNIDIGENRAVHHSQLIRGNYRKLLLKLYYIILMRPIKFLISSKKNLKNNEYATKGL